MLNQQFQCQICDYTVDHPVDFCPVCGEPFYWNLIPKQALQPNQRIAFLQIMEDIVEGAGDRAFMTHGDQIWLPHTFWQYCPDGKILDTFAWIKDLKLVQHDNQQKRQYFIQAQREAQAASAQHDTRPHPVANVPKSAPTEMRRRSGGRPAPPIQEPNPSIFGPIMVFTFFTLLALSYLTLLYHRNTYVPSTQIEETHDR